jgi:hypothetical protein
MDIELKDLLKEEKNIVRKVLYILLDCNNKIVIAENDEDNYKLEELLQVKVNILNVLKYYNSQVNDLEFKLIL